MYLAYLLFLSKISLSLSQQWYEPSTEEITISQQQDMSIEPFSARSNIECTLKCQLTAPILEVESVFVEKSQQCFCLSPGENEIHASVDNLDGGATRLMPHEVITVFVFYVYFLSQTHF